MTDLGFGEVGEGEEGFLELVLAEECEEVGLVFVFVGGFEQFEGVVDVGDAGVVAGGDGVESVVEGPLEEGAELDFAVAEGVGVWGEAGAVAVEEIIDDVVFVLVHEVDDAEGDAEGFGSGGGVGDVLLPGAVTGDAGFVDPVFHVSAGDVEALLEEESCGDAAIDAAGHGDEDFGVHNGMIRGNGLLTAKKRRRCEGGLIFSKKEGRWG